MTKKIAWMALGVLLMGGMVFGGLMLFRERLDYAGARAYTDEMLATEGVVRRFFEMEVGEWDEGARELAAGFDETMGRAKEWYRNFGESSALKNLEVRVKYDELADGIEKLERVRVATKWLVGLMEVANTEVLLELQPTAPGDFFAGMVEEMMEYLGKVEEFTKKYESGRTGDYGMMTEEYGVIMAEGEAMKQRYGQVALVDAVGVAEDEVWDWYGRLRGLMMILEGKR